MSCCLKNKSKGSAITSRVWVGRRPTLANGRRFQPPKTGSDQCCADPAALGRSCGDGKAVPPQPASLTNCQTRASVLHPISPRSRHGSSLLNPVQHPNDEASLMANCKSFLKSSGSRQHRTFFLMHSAQYFPWLWAPQIVHDMLASATRALGA